MVGMCGSALTIFLGVERSPVADLAATARRVLAKGGSLRRANGPHLSANPVPQHSIPAGPGVCELLHQSTPRRDPAMTTIRGVLLDIDGTLVGSNDAHARAWVKAFAEAGLTIRFEQVRPLIGMGSDKLIPRVSGIDPESKIGKRISERRGDIFLKEFVPELRPCRGAKELLDRLKARGMKLVVATSAKKKELDPLLKVCGTDRVIEAQTSSDDAENSKPDPDIVHAALKQIDLPAGEVVLLGDTPYDVEAATKAGVRMVAVRCGGWDDDALGGAAAIYDDPQDLVDHFDESPFGR